MRKVDNKPKLERQTPLALTTGDNCGRTINPTSIVPRWRRERDVRIRCNLFRPDSLGNVEELVKKEHGGKRKKGRKKGTREAERFANQGRTRREAPGIPGRQMRRRGGGTKGAKFKSVRSSFACRSYISRSLRRGTRAVFAEWRRPRRLKSSSSVEIKTAVLNEHARPSLTASHRRENNRLRVRFFFSSRGKLLRWRDCKTQFRILGIDFQIQLRPRWR